jgi:hypothetical protein
LHFLRRWKDYRRLCGDGEMRGTHSLYLNLLEKSLLDEIYGERPEDVRWRAFLQRLRHPYLTRRGTFSCPGAPTP